MQWLGLFGTRYILLVFWHRQLWITTGTQARKHTPAIPALQRLREQYCKFETYLVYILSSGLPWPAWQVPVSLKQSKCNKINIKGKWASSNIQSMCYIAVSSKIKVFHFGGKLTKKHNIAVKVKQRHIIRQDFYKEVKKQDVLKGG